LHRDPQLHHEEGRIVNFAFDEDQDRLRDSAVRFLRDRIDLSRITRQGNRPDTRYDPTLWQDIVALGWPSLLIPEEFGGSGLTLVDWIVINEELGRSLAPCPYLGTYAGSLALLRAGSGEQQERLLPGVASGAVRFALACSEAERADDTSRVDARVANRSLRGAKRYVIDADDATHFVATACDSTGALGLYLVERDQSSVAVDVVEWMDVTRRVATVRFDGARCEPLPAGGAAAWRFVLDRVLLALSAENAGGADAILRRTVDYAKQRIQFGKPIASYQAIKHKCADMLMKVESAKSLTYYCAWALAGNESVGPLAAAMAKSFTSDAFRFCTAEAVQIHGAIGFTWEMPVHLYFKRARANAVMFGAPAAHRDRVIDLVTAA
jgi:acyl-CoA dehydrogenase